MFIKFAALDTHAERVTGSARQGKIENRVLKFGSEGGYWLPVLRADFYQVAAAGYLSSYLETQLAVESGGGGGRLVFDVLAV